VISTANKLSRRVLVGGLRITAMDGFGEVSGGSGNGSRYRGRR